MMGKSGRQADARGRDVNNCVSKRRTARLSLLREDDALRGSILRSARFARRHTRAHPARTSRSVARAERSRPHRTAPVRLVGVPAHPSHLLNEPATRALAVAVMPTDGYNWFLILVACVCTVVVVAINVYILVHFQHPEDRNQAWWPKIVVVRARSTSIPRPLARARSKKTPARNPSPDPRPPPPSPTSSRCSA